MISLVFSCVTYEKCKKKFGGVATDTVKVLDTVEKAIYGDTNNVIIHDTVTSFRKETEKTVLNYRVDSQYRFIECVSKPDTVKIPYEKVVVQEKTIFKQTWYQRNKMLIWVGVGILILAFLIHQLFKFIKF